MFGISSSELLVILVVALIVLGPKNMPKIARTLGKAMGEFRRYSTEFQRTLNTEIAFEEEKAKEDSLKAREEAAKPKNLVVPEPAVSPVIGQSVSPAAQAEAKDASPQPLKPELVESAEAAEDNAVTSGAAVSTEAMAWPSAAELFASADKAQQEAQAALKAEELFASGNSGLAKASENLEAAPAAGLEAAPKAQAEGEASETAATKEQAQA